MVLDSLSLQVRLAAMLVLSIATKEEAKRKGGKVFERESMKIFLLPHKETRTHIYIYLCLCVILSLTNCKDQRASYEADIHQDGQKTFMKFRKIRCLDHSRPPLDSVLN
jgi:hypothetical protein